MKQENEIVSRLFRQEFSKMVAVISKLFGLQHIEVAEDIVSDTFLTAIKKWKEDGMPANATAWLYTVAKQKTLAYFRRDKIFTEKVLPTLKTGTDYTRQEEEPDFSGINIKDSQLRMMFAICHPSIASEAQIALALRVLCGFGIDEIAEAFLTSKETINKRLYRAKERLRTENIQLELPSENDFESRLDNVLHILYLLFNEGYYSTTQNAILRRDLCMDALKLGLNLSATEKTARPKTNALLALMCYHASRLEAREGAETYPVLYEQQDTALWNADLIEQGNHFLQLSANGDTMSSWHLEAGIAFWHTQREDTPEKWEAILQHYDILMDINFSPIVMLNRAYALYKLKGKETALAEALKLDLTTNHFYYVLLGELYTSLDNQKAIESFQRAIALARTKTEKQHIRQKVEMVKP